MGQLWCLKKRKFSNCLKYRTADSDVADLYARSWLADCLLYDRDEHVAYMYTYRVA